MVPSLDGTFSLPRGWEADNSPVAELPRQEAPRSASRELPRTPTPIGMGRISPRTAALRVAMLLMAVVAAACSGGPSPAAPTMLPATPEDDVIASALAIAARLDARGEAVPDVAGMTLDVAQATLNGLGAAVQPIAYDPSPVVSAQYPPAGEPLPPDGLVTVWLGEPPVPPPPPPPPPPPASVPGRGEDTGGAVTAGQNEPEPSPTPGHPPRTDIRTIPFLEVGTVLTGAASWYGDAFDGRGTACGTIFDPSRLTLATRDLRCGTLVRITGPTGASVEAVATDWGPAEWTDRLFDLSLAAFAAIHHPGAGLITVTVEVLGEAPPGWRDPPPEPRPDDSEDDTEHDMANAP
jgi:hypothetical protein